MRVRKRALATTSKPGMVLLTADVASSHSLKRAAFLASAFQVTLMGFFRHKQGADMLAPEASIIDAGRVGDGQYLGRLLHYMRLLWKLYGHRPDRILARGTDMMLIARCYSMTRWHKPLVLAEITDVYPASYKGPYSKWFFKLELWLYKMPQYVLATSPAFHHFYEVPQVKRILWENFVPNSFTEAEKNTALERKKLCKADNKKWWVNLSGYFRCQWTLDELERICTGKSECPFQVHLHGYANGGPFGNDRLQQLDREQHAITYHGPFSFATDLQKVFAPAHFTIVSEKSHLNQEGTLNLSNRIYESIACYTPCIAIGQSAISRYVLEHHLGLVFPSFDAMATYLEQLTPEVYEQLYAGIGFESFARYQHAAESQLSQFFQRIASQG